jgi:hypothetical protein
MLFWFLELKYFLPPYMSGPIVDATVLQTKRLIESVSYYVKTNILRRSK